MLNDVDVIKQNKIRVLILMHGLFPGYVAPVFKEIAKNLYELGYEVEVAAVGGGLTPNGENFKFKIHVIESKSIVKQYKEIISLTRGFDIVHYFLGKGFEFLPLFNKKTKFVFHFISVSVSGSFFYDLFINTLKKFQPAFADMALYTDIELKKNIFPYFKIKTNILPVGYASDLFFPCKPYQESDKRLLIFHGSCHPARKLEQMIKVLSLLEDRYELMIIGKGPEKYIIMLKNLSKELNCSHRLFFSEMAQDQIRNIIEKAYLCFSYVPVIDCYQDQFVLKTIEYLACGRPVITTNTRYTLKFQNEIGKNNLLVCQDDVNELALMINSSDNFVNQFYNVDKLEMLFYNIKKYSNNYLVKEKLNNYYIEILDGRN